MQLNDIMRFWASMAAMFGKRWNDSFHDDAMEIWLNALLDFSGNDLDRAAMDIMRSGRAHPPTLPEIYALCLGKDKKPTPEELIIQAQQKKTPLGVLAAIEIGSFDLNSQPARYLNDRAREFLADYESISARVSNCDYTPHELATMAKYGVVVSEVHGDNKKPALESVKLTRLANRNH